MKVGRASLQVDTPPARNGKRNKKGGKKTANRNVPFSYKGGYKEEERQSRPMFRCEGRTTGKHVGEKRKGADPLLNFSDHILEIKEAYIEMGIRGKDGTWELPTK